MSDYWESKNSVLSLLFNENFHVLTPGYITDYRKCNINSITDKYLLSRINLYRGRVEVYVNADDKYWDIFDMRNDAGYTNEFVTNINMDDVEKNLKGVSYSTERYFTTNYPLIKESGDGGLGEEEEQPPIINPTTNIFSITTEDAIMLDLLYFYKMDSPIPFSEVRWDLLTSPLQKLIYIYLDFCINGSIEHYDTRHKLTDDTNILHSVYEKFVSDFIYTHIEKQYGVVYRPVQVVNNKQIEINRDYFMLMKYKRLSVILTQQNINEKKIVYQGEEIPWDRSDFSLYKNGTLVKQDSVYKVSVNASNPEQPFFTLSFLNDSYVLGEKLVLIWSYIKPYGALLQDLTNPELTDTQFADLQNETVYPPKPDTYNLM